MRHLGVIFSFVVLLCLAAANPSSAGQIIYVNQNAPATSATNGTSWANAYRELRDVLNSTNLNPVAGNPVEIWVAKGTYLPAPAGSTNREATFLLKSHLRILGGFKGTETNDTQRLFFGYPTVLSGDIGLAQTDGVTHLNAEGNPSEPDASDTNFTDNCYNVVTGTNVTDIVLDKLFIANGAAYKTNVSGDYVDSMLQELDSDNEEEVLKGQTIAPLDHSVAGGGLYFEYIYDRPESNTDLVLYNCKVMNNYSVGFGGGMAAKEANLQIVATLFSNNSADEDGGGVFLQGCRYTVEACTFTNNYCGGSGGGISFQTLTSRRTMPTYADHKTFEDETGISEKDFKKAVSYSRTGYTLAPKIVSTLRGLAPRLTSAGRAAAASARLASNAPKVGALRSFGNKVRAALPTNPFTSAKVDASGKKITAGGRAAAAYAYLCYAVTAIDLGVEIAKASGVSTNDTFIKGWTVFSENFNTYCTPTGLTALLVTKLTESVSNQYEETSVMRAFLTKEFELQMYNQQEESRVLFCKFVDNFAGTIGGAVNCSHDNIQFEGCSFTRNTGADDGGALSLTTWTTPKVFSCTFYQNISTNGHSAIANHGHARTQIINSTFYQNHTDNTNASAIGAELGSEIKILNSILWANTRTTNNLVGADIFASTKALISNDTNLLARYNDAKDAYGDWIGICDVASSCVQSLHQIPLGTDNIPLFTQHAHYTQAEVDEILANKQIGEDGAKLEYFHFINLGEGIRPTLLDASKHNIDSDPLLDENLVPSAFSPVVDAGSLLVVDNDANRTISGLDVKERARKVGASLDMGAVENQQAFSGSEIVYVRPTATGNGTGSSWANATADLKTAMNKAGAHTVWVAAGTYYPTSGSDRTISFALGEQVAVFGGFAGTETNLNQRNWKVNQTILSGDIGVHGNDSDNSYHVVENHGITDTRTVLDGFYITKGRANGSIGDIRCGGGILNVNASPLIQNCVFTDNQASDFGGAIYARTSENTLNSCSFSNNVTTLAGGAVYMDYTRLWMRECQFINNTSAYGGGMVVNTTDSALIYNSLFVSNSVSGVQALGGALVGTNAGLRVFNSTFTMNSVVATNSRGGGAIDLSGYRSYLGSLDNCIFWHNTATNKSGASPTLENQQISVVTNGGRYITHCLVEGLENVDTSFDPSNVDVDPQFANPAAGNFRLTAASPAVDSGTDHSGPGYPNVDLDGNSRMTNVTMDLGAFEYQGTPIKASYKIALSQTCDETGAIYNLRLTGTNSAATTYQWQVNKSDGAGWTLVPNGGVYFGATSTNLLITHPSVAYNGYRYRLSISLQGATFTSTTIKIKVNRTLTYVRAGATGANDGSSWGNAYTNLQTALETAASCSQIWVAAGNYSPGTNAYSFFQLIPNVAIYGGFAGTELILADRNWRANVTTLNGNQTNLFLIFNNGTGVGGVVDAASILDGFTLTGATDTAANISSCNPTIRNCTFANNNGQYGAALRLSDQANPIVFNCVFNGNSANEGGAVNCASSAPQFIGCLFYNNKSDHRGGAIDAFRSTMTMINCTIVDNVAKSDGGGIYQQQGTNQVLNSILWGNKDGKPLGTLADRQAFVEPSVGGVLNIQSSSWQGATNGNLRFDPLFVNANGRNYRLLSSSPLINAGNNTYASGIATDADGNARVFQGAVDIGAYELQTAAFATANFLATPQPVTLCDLSQAVTFQVEGTNSGTNFQWQVNTNGTLTNIQASSIFSIAVSGNTSTLTVTNISASMNGWQFVAKVISSGAVTPAATLTVNSPTIIYVKANAAGSGTGSSWVNAFTNLSTALALADSCTEIWVAKGTYSPQTLAGVSAFRLKSGVGVYGGFFGNETSRNARNWTTNITSLVRNTNSNIIIGNDAYRGAIIDATAVLDGFTFSSGTNGAAIRNWYGNPTIRNCVFKGNSGNGILNLYATPVISSCVFSNNAGISIYNQLSSVSISGCTFTNNNVDTFGGAIFNQGSTVEVDNCLFLGNNGNFAGAIFNLQDTSVSVSRCMFMNNTSRGAGVVHNGSKCSLSMKNCVLNGNSSEFKGGAILHYGSSLLVENCTIVNNFAQDSGAGIYNQGSGAIVKNSIMWNNHVSDSSVVSSPDLVQIDNSSAQPTVVASDIQGLSFYAGNGNSGYDPLFADLGNGDLTLTGYSPAIDAGTNDTDVTSVDFAGNTRVFGGGVDVGAYERQSGKTGVLNLLVSPSLAVSTCVGSTAQFSVVGEGTNNYSYQWQQLVGGSFVNVDSSFAVTGSANSSALTATNLSYSQNGTVLRLTVTGTSYVSSNLTLTVTPPSVIYVDAAHVGAGTGSSWSTAFKSLHDAISIADGCSEIWVAKGTYYSTNNSGTAQSIRLKQGVRIYGGFAGTESQRADRNVVANPTILQAVSGDDPAVYVLGLYNPVDSSSILDGFTIRGQGGYAIINFMASPRFENCTITTTNGSGVMNTEHAAPVFVNCLFANNANGAFISIPRSSPTVINSVFINNSYSYGGGAIFNGYGDIQLIDCRFTNNISSTGSGGALYQSGAGKVTCTRCIFSGNSSVNGGAIEISSATAELTDCLLVDNVSTKYRAGAIYAELTTLVMNNCTVARNTAAYDGGGLYFVQGVCNATNSIFWFNVSHDYSPTLEQQQVVGNLSTAAFANCAIQGLNVYAGNNNTPYDPLFVNMTANNFSLSLVSPLLNVGLNLATNSSSLDVGGNPRVAFTAVDIGAYEQQSAAQSPLRLVQAPQSQSACAGNVATFSVVGDGSTSLSLTWQVNAGTGFTNVAASSNYIISTNSYSSTLVVTNLTTGFSGWQFRYVVDADVFNSVPVTLTVTPRDVIYVNVANINGTQTGASWSTALTNLQTALSMADSCSEVWVAAGTYTPKYLLGLNSFAIPPGVQVYGGFAGTESNRSDRNPSNNRVLLQGNGQGEVVYLDGLNNVIDANVVLDGVTITSAGSEAGIRSFYATPTIRNCVFARNPYLAVSLSFGGPLFDSCTFVSNSVCTVLAQSSIGLVFTNCVFTNNITSYGNVLLYDKTTSPAQFSNCRFVNNTSEQTSAGLYIYYGASIVAANCTFTGNKANDASCLRLSEKSSAVLVNCLFAKNAAYYDGGAIFNERSQLRLVNTTVTKNTAGRFGGGIESYEATNTVLNSIFWNNLDANWNGTEASQQVNLDRTNDVLVLSNSCFQGTTNTVAGNLNFNPLFTDDTAANFTLSANSPAINSGNNSFISGYSKDLAGNSRIQLTTVDMGCYESATAGTPLYLQGAPGSQSRCPGDVASFTFTVTNGNPANLTWMYNDRTNWLDFNSGPGNTLTRPSFGSYFRINTSSNTTLIVSNIVTALDGYRFQAASGGLPVASAVTLIVKPGATIYVNASAFPGGDGTSWDTAYNNLQTALADAGTCHPVIWVAEGTYFPTTGTNQSFAFQLVAGTAIYGGFAGNETNLNQRVWQAHPTILSGDIGNAGQINDNAFYVLSANGMMSTNTIVDGFIVEKGLNGGVVADTASPTIQNCVIRANNGHGVFFNNASPTLQSCSVVGNSGAVGGGLELAGGVPRVVDCVISGNVATNGGGGVYTLGGDAQVVNCLITGNKAGTGGGVYRAIASGSLELSGSTISGNFANDAGGVWGGPGPHTYVYNTILWGNLAAGTDVVKMQRNTSSGGSFDDYHTCVQGGTIGMGVLTNNPVFVNPISASNAPTIEGDYHLQSCSPEIDAGDTFQYQRVGVTKDVDGASRFHGTADIGCYESTAASEQDILISVAPVSRPYCATSLTAFSVTATGAGLTYQWQANFSDGNGFVPLVDSTIFLGTATSQLTVTNASSALDQSQYRCVLTSSAGCSLVTDPVTLTIRPERLYVKAGTPAGGNGLSWNTAFRTIQDALNSSSLDTCGAEIWVAAGLYTPPGSGVYLQLTNHVAIYGGFSGTETSLTQRNWKTNASIIDSTGSTYIFYNRPIYTPIDNSARLDGFVLRNAYQAIYNDAGYQTPGASPTIANCTFSNNVNAIQCYSSSSLISTPVIQDCVFVNNGPGINFGASCIGFQAVDALIERCVFQANNGSGTTVVSMSDHSHPRIYNCLVSGNTTGASMISSDNTSVPDIRNCTIVGNKSTGEPAGVRVSSAGQINNCIIWGNEGQSGPRSQAQLSGTSVVVRNSTIQGYASTANNNLNINPQFYQFVAAASAPTKSGNFHLLECSTAVNSGDNSYADAAALTVDGKGRIAQGTVDRGVYENEALVLAAAVVPVDQSGYTTNGVSYFAVPNMDNCTLQWEVNRGSGFVNTTNGFNYSGVTTETLSVTNLSVTLNGYLFRLRMQSPDGCIAYSPSAAFHLIPGSGAPTVSGTNTPSILEGSTATIATYTKFSPDGLTMTFSVGGEDGALFQISSGGALSFIAASDFVNPLDANHDNLYNVIVVVTDSLGNAGSLPITVTVRPSKVHFLSSPITTAYEDQFYLYYLLAVGPSSVTYSAPVLPGWLQLRTNFFAVTTLAGNGSPGEDDGPPDQATFNYTPYGVLDSTGNLFVVDYGNNRLRKVSPSGVVTAFPPSFMYPNDVSIDAADNLYIADAGLSQILKCTPDGTVTALADVYGISNLAADRTGSNIYFTVTGSQAIYRYRSDTGVIVFAGDESEAGLANGTNTAARFNTPLGMVVDASGKLYVADYGNHAIRVVTTNGVVSTLAGGNGSGFADGTGSAPKFAYPQGVAVDASGNIYVADSGNYSVRKVTAAGKVTTPAGNGTYGYQDGFGTDALFSYFTGVAVNPQGTNVYVMDAGNFRIRKLALVPAAIFGTPSAGDVGPNAVNLLASSGAVSTNQSFTIDVQHVNHPPVSFDSDVTGVRDHPVSFSLQSADSDSADTLGYTVLSQPEHGVLSGTEPNLTYTPDTNFFGDDSFTFLINDGTADSGIATVHLHILETYTLNVWMFDANRTYGEGNPSDSGLVYADGIQPGLEIGVTYTTDADPTSPVGAYNILPYFIDPDGHLPYYTIITNQIGTLFVNPASMTVVPDDKFIHAGDVTPLLTAHFDGAANGETFTPILSLSPSRPSSALSSVKNYGINVVGLVPDSRLNNYFVSFASGMLHVLKPTTVTKAPTVSPGAKEPEGMTITFGVAAAGTPPFSYQWYHDGNVVGSDSANYIIDRALIADSGSYHCVITDQAGSAVTSPTTLLTVTNDIGLPAVAIKLPKDKSENTSGDFVVNGAAKDNSRIVNVQTSLNDADWADAPWFAPEIKGGNAQSAVWANWDLHAPDLLVGTNWLKARAVDWQGTFSKVVSNMFIYNVPSTLALAINNVSFVPGVDDTNSLKPESILSGSTKIAPLESDGLPRGITNGAILWINRGPYTVTAVPGANQVLSNWTATWQGQDTPVIVSTNLKYTFNMKADLSLTMNVIHNPYLEAAGTYYGLFLDDETNFNNSGFVSMKLDSARALSGTLSFGGDDVPFSAKLPLSGDIVALPVSRAKFGKPNLTLDITVRFGSAGTTGTNQIVGTLHLGTTSVSLVADQSRQTEIYDGKQFTAFLSDDSENVALAPGNYGWLNFSVPAGKNISAKGGLSDSSSLSPLGALPNLSGQWPFYAPLYGAKAVTNANGVVVSENLGALIGWLQFADTDNLGGTLQWVKMATTNANRTAGQIATAYTATYANGFTNTLNLTGKSYTPPGAGMNLFGLTTPLAGVITFEKGNLSGPQSATLILGADGKVRMTSTNSVLGSKLTVKFDSKVGGFSGSFMRGTTTVPFSGVVSRSEKKAYGSFSGTTESGTVTFDGN